MAHDEDVEPHDEQIIVPRGEPAPEPEHKPRFRDQSAADLRGKLDQWKQRAEQRDQAQPKLTREQIAQDAAARQQRRQDKKAQRAAIAAKYPQRRVTKLNMGLGAVGVIAAMGVAGLSVAAQDGRDAELAAQEQQVQDLSTEIAQLRPQTVADDADVDDPSVVADSVYAATDDARALAEDVAAAQQQFATLYHATNDESVDGDGPKPSAEEAAEHRATLGEYFGERAMIVDDELLTQPSTMAPFNDDQIDARYPWYLQQDGTDYADPAEYRWEVGGVSPVQGNTNLVWVVWMNEDTETQELLSWAQSYYDVEEEVFTSLEVGYSATGTSRGGVTGAPVGQAAHAVAKRGV